VIDSIRIASERIGHAVDLSRQLSTTDPHQPVCAPLLTELAGELAAFDDGMKMVIEKLPPTFFYDELRPFFEFVEIGGNQYRGPAVGHLPLYLVDLVLWSADQGTEGYHDFRLESVEYSLPQWRAIEPALASGASLVTRTRDALIASAPGPATLHESAAALAAALRTLVAFRGKHITVARRSYPAEYHHDDLPGGGSVPLLQEILDLVRHMANLVRPATVTVTG
jgi:hypothetical protein